MKKNAKVKALAPLLLSLGLLFPSLAWLNSFAAQGDDLFSAPSLLWTNPEPLQVGYKNSSIGLIVERSGGRNTLDEVTIEFRLDNPDGDYLGRSLTNLLPPEASESTEPLIWEPAAGGEYTICAIIDPDNEVQEADEENNVYCRPISVQEVLIPSPIPAPPKDALTKQGSWLTKIMRIVLDAAHSMCSLSPECTRHYFGPTESSISLVKRA